MVTEPAERGFLVSPSDLAEQSWPFPASPCRRSVNRKDGEFNGPLCSYFFVDTAPPAAADLEASSLEEDEELQGAGQRAFTQIELLF